MQGSLFEGADNDRRSPEEEKLWCYVVEAYYFRAGNIQAFSVKEANQREVASLVVGRSHRKWIAFSAARRTG